MNNLVSYLFEKSDDDSVALLYRDRTISYGELRAQIAVVANALRENGAVPGERIGMLSENIPFFVTSYLAIIAAGCCAVPLTANMDLENYGYIAATCGMKKIFVQNKFLQYTADWIQKAELSLFSEADIDGMIKAAENRGDKIDLKPVPVDTKTSLAAIMFTSGSTGQPKGVMVSHRNIECNTDDIIEYMRLTSQDRILAVLPFSYCFGASLLHTHLRAGGSIALISSFMFPEKVIDEMESKQCTGFAGVPSTFQILLRKTTFAKRRFDHLKWVQQAGGKLPNAFIQEFREAHPSVSYVLMYGQTEATARLSYLPPELLDRKLGSVGRGLASGRLEVLKPDGSPVKPGSDETGEIVASGDNITSGYWQDPDETKLHFRDGKLYTGDLARVDAEGYIFIVDRARDFIKSGGNRVSSKEIEDVISEHPEVVHAAVIGVPDELLGEAILAAIVPRRIDYLTPDEVITFCNARLANYKVPRVVLILPRLPMNAYNKIMKEELRSQLPQLIAGMTVGTI